MIKTYAYKVIEQGIERQILFNKRFMIALRKCMDALDKADSVNPFVNLVFKITEDLREADPQCADALAEYIEKLIKDSESIESDFNKLIG